MSSHPGTQLFVRALDALEPVAIASSGAGLRAPFISPDGQWVGFIVGSNTLQRVAMTGGPPLTLAGLDGSARGATWAPDDTIVFATLDRRRGCSACRPQVGRPKC